MTPEQVTRVIDQRMAKLQKGLRRDAPRIVGKHAVDFYRKSFVIQGFQDSSFTPWKPSRRIGTAKGAAGSYPTLLSRRKELYNSIKFVPGDGRVNIRSDKPYSGIHNYGGVVHPTVTPQMRKWAWAKYYELIPDTKQFKKTGHQYSNWNSGNSKKMSFYRGLALTKKKKLSITIPKRQFIGYSKTLNGDLRFYLTKYVKQILFN